MSLKENLQQAIDEVKAKGIKNIPTENLENWLVENSSEPSKVDFQTRELVHQSTLAKYHADVEYDLEEFRVVLRISEFIIRWLIIVSGSACVALLALIGNIWSAPENTAYICILLAALKWFGCATICGLLAAGAFYFTQYSSRYYKRDDVWKGWRKVTIALVAIAIGCLGVGAIGLSFEMTKLLRAKTSNSPASTSVVDSFSQKVFIHARICRIS